LQVTVKAKQLAPQRQRDWVMGLEKLKAKVLVRRSEWDWALG
jgi:hypothetical protein